MEAFVGFGPAAFEFFAKLAESNTRSFWEANRSTYEREIRTPMERLIENLDERFRPMRIYRPHRDTRFSTDKSPYKTFIGAVGEQRGGSGHYVQISATGLLAGAGYPAFAPDQLARFRAAVDDASTGDDLARRVDEMKASGFPITGGYAPSLKNPPKGFPRDHPRLALLKRKGLVLNHDVGKPAWLATPEALLRIQSLWRTFDPVGAWLNEHVGPSSLPPEVRFGRR